MKHFELMKTWRLQSLFFYSVLMKNWFWSWGQVWDWTGTFFPSVSHGNSCFLMASGRRGWAQHQPLMEHGRSCLSIFYAGGLCVCVWWNTGSHPLPLFYIRKFNLPARKLKRNYIFQVEKNLWLLLWPKLKFSVMLLANKTVDSWDKMLSLILLEYVFCGVLY